VLPLDGASVSALVSALVLLLDEASASASLLDPELVSASASLLESVLESVSELAVVDQESASELAVV